MLRCLAEGIYATRASAPGAAVCIGFGIHGNERAPIDAGLQLLTEFQDGRRQLQQGRLLFLFGNPRAAAEDRRWSADGSDLNRCFVHETLDRAPRSYEEQRAREIVEQLQVFRPDVLVDFHCTVEPGQRFLMQHPPISDASHRAVARFLSAEVVLADPQLQFGAVSLDEWVSVQDRVGICYETGWIHSPDNTPDKVHQEMIHLLQGTQLLPGEAVAHDDKRWLQLDGLLICDGHDFTWRPGIGQNLQELPKGTVLGHYGDGRRLSLPATCTLVFPRKRRELMQFGKPLVYLARTASQSMTAGA